MIKSCTYGGYVRRPASIPWVVLDVVPPKDHVFVLARFFLLLNATFTYVLATLILVLSLHRVPRTQIEFGPLNTVACVEHTVEERVFRLCGADCTVREQFD